MQMRTAIEVEQKAAETKARDEATKAMKPQAEIDKAAKTQPMGSMDA